MHDDDGRFQPSIDPRLERSPVPGLLSVPEGIVYQVVVEMTSHIGPPVDAVEPVEPLNRSAMATPSIDPNNLYFSRPADNDIDLDMDFLTSFAPSPAESAQSAHPEPPLTATRKSTSSTKKSKPSRHLDNTDSKDQKTYAPRQPLARKPTRKALRVKPRNSQHARELDRNRNAAASYRSRQKNQVDSLLTRMRDEEQRMIKQRDMVYSLRDELWHLRNEFIAQQQLQAFDASRADGWRAQ